MLLGAPGIATRNKGLTTRNKKLVETIYKLELKTSRRTEGQEHTVNIRLSTHTVHAMHEVCLC